MSKELLPTSIDRLYDQHIMSPPSNKYDFQLFVKDNVLHAVRGEEGCNECFFLKTPECNGPSCGAICDAIGTADWHFGIKKELHE